jgi:hypothetical protein
MTSTNKINENSNAQPTHTLRKKKGYGKKAEFETIGVAWAREEIFITLSIPLMNSVTEPIV